MILRCFTMSLNYIFVFIVWIKRPLVAEMTYCAFKEHRSLESSGTQNINFSFVWVACLFFSSVAIMLLHNVFVLCVYMLWLCPSVPFVQPHSKPWLPCTITRSTLRSKKPVRAAAPFCKKSIWKLLLPLHPAQEYHFPSSITPRFSGVLICGVETLLVFSV